LKSIVSELLLLRMSAPSDEATYKRLYRHFRAAILDGSIALGQRLPASRDLASELGIARNTVVSVYNQLHAEGYTQSKQGSGTFVCDHVPDAYPQSISRKPQINNELLRTLLSDRGNRIIQAAPTSPSAWGAFMPGVPDVTLFPYQKFARGLTRKPSPEMLAYSHGGGLPMLQEALANHLKIVRSVQCEADQIVITEGIHQAIDLTVRLLGAHQDNAWIEDPGYWGARSVFIANGINTIPIPVDHEGMCLPPAIEAPIPRFIFVTPSHQYPLGSVMSLERRLKLIALAREWGSWIIEDDYDSEFRFSERPIPALQGLEQDAPVIYMGTFSKTMFPSLRLSYMVLPKTLAQAFKTAHTSLYREGHIVTQSAVAQFIMDGDYASHVLRMRKIYSQRREMLASLVQRRLGQEWLTPEADNAGLHLTLSLPENASDTKIVELARARGILTRPLSQYYSQNSHTMKQGLLLGYACVPEEKIVNKFETLLKSIVTGLKD
jgi:GntR family transcriptional regulator/MocR family aminotransferase